MVMLVCMCTSPYCVLHNTTHTSCRKVFCCATVPLYHDTPPPPPLHLLTPPLSLPFPLLQTSSSSWRTPSLPYGTSSANRVWHTTSFTICVKTRESGTISPNKLPCECQTKVPTKPHCDTPLYSLIYCTEIPSPTKCSSFYRVCVCVSILCVGVALTFIYCLFVCFWLFVWFTAFYHYPSCRPLCCIIHCVALSLYACIYVYDFMYVSIHVQM